MPEIIAPFLPLLAPDLMDMSDDFAECWWPAFYIARPPNEILRGSAMEAKTVYSSLLSRFIKYFATSEEGKELAVD